MDPRKRPDLAAKEETGVGLLEEGVRLRLRNPAPKLPPPTSDPVKPVSPNSSEDVEEML